MTVAQPTTKMLTVVLASALILAAAGVLLQFLQIFLLLFAGLLFGVFFGGIVSFFHRHLPVSYHVAFAVILVISLVVVAGGFSLMGTRAFSQFSTLSEQLRSAFTQLQEYLGGFSSFKNMLGGDKEGGMGLPAMPILKTGVNWLLWFLSAVFVVLFVGLYLAFDPGLYERGVVKLFPHAQRDRALATWQGVRSVLGHWIVGRLFSMSVIGIATAIYLRVLGVPLPYTLAVLATWLTFIPNIGPLLAAVPQALLAFQVSWTTVWWVLGLNVIMQGLESYLLTPLVQRRQVDLPPALTISAQLIFGTLFGALGLLLAAPITAVGLFLVQKLYVQQYLGDEEVGEGVINS